MMIAVIRQAETEGMLALPGLMMKQCFGDVRELNYKPVPRYRKRCGRAYSQYSRVMRTRKTFFIWRQQFGADVKLSPLGYAQLAYLRGKKSQLSGSFAMNR